MLLDLTPFDWLKFYDSQRSMPHATAHLNTMTGLEIKSHYAYVIILAFVLSILLSVFAEFCPRISNEFLASACLV